MGLLFLKKKQIVSLPTQNGGEPIYQIHNIVILSLRAQRGNLTFKVVPIDTVNVNYLIYVSSEREGA